MKPRVKRRLWTIALLLVVLLLGVAAKYMLWMKWQVYYVSVQQPEVFSFVRYEEEKFYPDGPGGRTIVSRHPVYAFRFGGRTPREVICWVHDNGDTRLYPVFYYTREKPRSGWKKDKIGFGCGLSVMHRPLQPDTNYEFIDHRGHDRFGGTRHYAHVATDRGDYFVSEALEHANPPE